MTLLIVAGALVLGSLVGFVCLGVSLHRELNGIRKS